MRISPLTGSELDSTLAHLEQSEIVELVDDKTSPRYAFKHALVRDAAYESLLKSSRADIHGRVASTLEKEWPETIAGQPELLAYHYSMARNPEFAALYWLSGGRRARSRSANLEAIVQFQNALEFLELLPNSPERMAKELEVQLSLGLCFIAVRGYSSDDTRKSFERARSLSAEIGDPQKEIQATFGLWGHYWMRARHDQALEHGETLLARAEQLRDPLSLSVGHRVLGSTLFTAGEFVRAREHLERAVALGLRAATENASLAYAVDPRIAAQLMLAWDLWVLGYPEQARHTVFQALALVSERADPYTVAFAHYVASAVQLLRGQFGTPSCTRIEAWLCPASTVSISMPSIHASDAAAHSRGWARKSRRFPKSGRASRTRAAATSDTCAGSCSDGWQPYKFRLATPKPRCPPSTTRWRKSTTFPDARGRRSFEGCARMPCWRCVPTRRLRRSVATMKPSPSRRSSRPARWNCERPRRWHGCCRARAEETKRAEIRRDLRLVHRRARHSGICGRPGAARRVEIERRLQGGARQTRRCG